jgi:uncharacterized protein (TIGR02453 family)
MGFRGWPAAALEFYDDLEIDNSREFWLAHKPIYQESVLAPMEALLVELAPEFGEGRIFRPNRDVRFSNDKSPYKTAIGAMVGDSGYVQLSAEGLAVGCGYYMMAPDQLDRYRRAVADDGSGDELVSIIETVERAGVEITAHDTLKTAPKGYPKDHPRIELLRHKGLIAWKQWAAAKWLATPAAKKRVVDVLVAAQPLLAWLDRHVGPSTMPTDRR